MTPEECIEELAPAVVVRAALFPLGRLLRLADGELAALAAHAGSEWPSTFEEAYAASMEKQRRTLAAGTIEDPRFLRALCLTNDDLSRRIARQPSLPPQHNKRARHLDTTLYRYLARAVWRTEPCDLWAGVALGPWAGETRIAAAPARYAVAPDLRPYQFLVQSLARTRPYIEKGIYKLNPTLKLDRARQRWKYTVRIFSSIVSRERPCSPGVDAMLRALAQMEPATLGGIAAEFRRMGFVEPALEDILAALEGAGLLAGGLAFPRTFSSAWDALMAAPRDLREDHARAWRSAVVRLRRLCRGIERKLETISLAELHDALDEARSIPAVLAAALGVEPPPLPRSVLRCDTRLPFSIAFGPEVKARLTKTVAEYDLFERYQGIDLAARTAHRRLMLDNPGVRPSPRRDECGRIQTQESAWRAVGADPVLGTRLERWTRCLQAGGCDRALDGDEHRPELKPPPIGGLMLRPRQQGYEISGSTTEIAATYGRYGQIWYGLSERAHRRFEGHVLHEWYQSALAKVAHEANVEVVEYAGPCEALPNGLARPRFAFRVWDRWGTATPFRADQLRVDLSNGASVALVHQDGCPRPIALTCFSPVNLGFSEPYLECLLLSSFREIPAWIAPGMPLECEMAQEQPSPALALPSGSTVKLRRTLLHGAALAELVAAKRSRRFLLWQALARKYSWPALVLVARDGGAALPVVRDSPLALEAALQGLREGVSLLSIEEPDEHTWLFDEKGEGVATELIVPFVRRQHAWSELART